MFRGVSWRSLNTSSADAFTSVKIEENEPRKAACGSRDSSGSRKSSRKLLASTTSRFHEAEQVFQNLPNFRFVEKGYQEGEDVYSALGRTDAGRYVIVFFVRKLDGRALPVTARDMTSAERRIYGRN